MSTRLPYPVLFDVAHDAQANFEVVNDHLDDLGSATQGALLISKNLQDLGNVATARTNLGLGTAATHAASDFSVPPGVIAIPCTARPNVLTHGTWTAGFDANCFAATLASNSSSAQNDEFRWWVPLSAGTWRLDWGTRQDVDRAVVTWDVSFDGGGSWTSIGTSDGYNATPTTVLVSFTGITVPALAQTAVLRARVLTRNASNTTGWLMTFSTLALVRTA